jgi:hypothetical protein
MERRPASTLNYFLAGLQAGMIAALWMLTWMGLCAMWQRRSFWNPENLMASVLQGNSAIRSGFGPSTLAGLALYLMIYSLLGAAFACLVRDRLTRKGILLTAILFAAGWYTLWFRDLGRTLMPLVWLLHAERATVAGHVFYGALVARFPLYLPPGATPPGAPADAAAMPETEGVPARSDTDH